MATHACRVGEVVVIVDVAIRALPWRYGMRTGQGESGLGVIKIRRRPSAGRVANLASRRNTLLRVVGILGVLVVGHVTRHAAGIRNVVVVVHVAIRTLPWGYGVLASQRESRLRMIEVGRLPGRGRVARFTGLRKPKLHVIGISRALVVLQMA